MRAWTSTAGIIVVAAAVAGGCADGGGGNGSGSLSQGFVGQTIQNIGNLFGHGQEVQEGMQAADSAQRVAESAAGLAPLGPREEYHLGRAVTANVIHRYGVLEDGAATRYVNLVGQSIAMSSPEPTTWGGYRFIILDTDEVNAIAAPGGFVMVTRGMLSRCRNEHAVAAVLAHEIAHVQQRHGLELVQNKRGQDFMVTLGQEVAKNLGDRNVVQLSQLLSGFVDDFLGALLESGYSREAEYESDALALTLMRDAGYDPHGMHDVLRAIDRAPARRAGWFSTHPAPGDRLDRLDVRSPRAVASDARESRFRAAMAAVHSR